MCAGDRRELGDRAGDRAGARGGRRAGGARRPVARAARVGRDEGGRRRGRHPADLTQAGAVETAVDAACAALGQIDILFANAGLYIPGDVAAGDPDKWDELLTVNVNAVFRLVRAVLPEMIARQDGDVIVTSSVSGHQAIQWEPVYSASKHAVQSFVHGLRRQVGPDNVRVGAVAPGVVLNELWGYSDPAAIAAKVASREGLRSEDVADAVLFMLTRPANVTIRDLVILPSNQDI